MRIIRYIIRAAMYAGLVFIAHVLLRSVVSPLGLACILGLVLAMGDD